MQTETTFEGFHGRNTLQMPLNLFNSSKMAKTFMRIIYMWPKNNAQVLQISCVRVHPTLSMLHARIVIVNTICVLY